MNRITRLASVAAAVVAVVYAGTLIRATPASGFSGATLWHGTFDDMKLKQKVAQYDWEAELETEGATEMYGQSNTWAARGDANFPNGGSTGWHTHPGFSLIIVTEGAVTVYDGSDTTCTGTTYSAGQTLVDPGNGHVHLIRNEGSVVAKTIAVQFVPTAVGASGRRLDATDPGNCPF